LRFSIKDGSLGKAAVRRRQAQKPAARSHLRHFFARPRSTRNTATAWLRRRLAIAMEPELRDVADRRVMAGAAMILAAMSCHDIAALRR